MNINNYINYWAQLITESEEGYSDNTKIRITEGKHWPADYVKTAVNMIKSSDLGRQSWYSDDLIQKDCETFAQEFSPLSHKNSNLGFFSVIIRWFIEYSGSDKNRYREFIERKLDDVIRNLQIVVNDSTLKPEDIVNLKTVKFYEFEEFIKRYDNMTSDVNVKSSSDDYDIIRIDSYQELHQKFGGDKTGYKGESEWCHTNGSSTYESWTSNGTYNFFVLARKGWEKTIPPDPNQTNAYDDYGLSLIALLVNTKTYKLRNATLRWNHVIEPSRTVDGTSVDRAFLNWEQLNKVIGRDVQSEIVKNITENPVKIEPEMVYDGPEGKCYATDHLEWFDSDGNKINPPQKIGGSFVCSRCTSLTSLEGAPQKVGGYFWCYNCESLTTLEGAPREVGGDFKCQNCESLTTLEGAPREVGRDFVCIGCKSLTSLKGAPQKVGVSFYCGDCESLTTLEGAPQKVGGEFDCSMCKSLTTLEGAPQKVGGDFWCEQCDTLTSLKGAPQEVGGNFVCSRCTSLTSLEGSPQYVDGNFVCRRCTSLTSLEGAEHIKNIQCDDRLRNK